MDWLSFENIQDILGIIATILVVVGYIPKIYTSAKEKKWDELRKVAYNLFADAEKTYKSIPNSGQQKMNFVLDKVYNKYAPEILRKNYTYAQLQDNLEDWFQEIKASLHEK